MTTNTTVYAKSALHSSVIKHIAVGTLRGQHNRDVVFAKETVLELLELTDSGHLISLMEQPVFGTIKDMKLLHCQFDSTDAAPDTTGHTSRINYTPPPMPPVKGDDVLVLTSDSGVLSFVSFDVPSAVDAEDPEVITNPWGQKPAVAIDRKGKAKTVAEPPPQLAKSKSDGEAVYALDEASRYGRFTTVKQIYLSSPGFGYKDPGHSLCIDPLSRAIVVTALQDNFEILLLHPQHSRSRFDPVKERGKFTQEGIIWQAAFLYPNPTESDRVLLSMVVMSDVQKVYRIVIYQFYTTSTLSRATVYAKLPFPADSSLPLHIVPLPRYPGCFLLITERDTCFIRAEDATSGHVYFPLPTPLRERGDANTSAIQNPLITSTALPLPDPFISDTTQHLYAGTATGLIYRIDVTKEPNVDFTLLGKRNPVGTAMCVLMSGMGFVGEEEHEGQDEDSEEAEKGDVIVYSGEMADGEVLLARPTRSQLSTLQLLPNHAPVIDFAVLDPRHQGSDSIFACSGRGPRHGAVWEIRNGIGVKVMHRSDPEWDGVTGLWNLRNRPMEDWDEFLVVSFASETRVMYNGTGDLDDITDTSGFDVQAPTLCAATLAYSDDIAQGGYLVQVHTKAIVVVRPALAEYGTDRDTMIVSGIPVSYRWAPSSPDTYISLANVVGRVAVICLSAPEQEYTVMALRIDVARHVRIFCYEMVTFTELSRMVLDAEPSFINSISVTFPTCPLPLCIIGTYKPSIKFLFLSDNGLSLVHEEMLSEFAVEGTNTPESATILGDDKPYFLAGLREGTIICYQWSWDSDTGRPVLQNPFVRRLGTLPIQLVPSSTLQRSQQKGDLHTTVSTSLLAIFDKAILAFSDRIWRITPARAGLSFTSVPFDRKYQVIGATPFSFKDAGSGSEAVAMSERYMIVAGRCLNIVQLDRFKQNNMRKLSIKDTPRRILYDKHSEKLLVACVKEGAPFPTSVIKIVDPLNGDILHEEKLRDRESIFSMIEWSITLDAQVYHYVCIGTGVYNLSGASASAGRGQQEHQQTPPVPEKGSLIIFSLRSSKNPGGARVIHEDAKVMKLVCQKDNLKGPVVAICPYIDSHLLVASGKILYLYHLEPVHERLTEVIRKEAIRYPVTSLNAHGTRICVGSQRDSLSFYDCDVGARKFEFLKSDRRARVVTSSIMLTENLAVGADRAGSVFGLAYDFGDPSFERRLRPAFAYHHPELILRLQRGMLIYPQLSERPINSGTNTGGLLDWSDASSSQLPPSILIGCSMLGGVLLFGRINQIIYDMLSVLQEVMETWESSRPLLGASHRRHRSASAPTSNVVDGDLIIAFLRMRAGEQRRLVASAAAEGLKKVVAKFLLDEEKGTNKASAAPVVDDGGEMMIVDREEEIRAQEMSMSVEKVVEVIERVLERLNEMM